MLDTETLSLEALERQIGALTEADSPAEIFKLLLESSRLASPRAAMFLVRQGRIKGWGAVGYPAESARRIRECDAAGDEGWLGALAASPGPLKSDDADGSFPDFSPSPAVDRFGVPVRVKGRPIALLVLERSEGQLPWHGPVAAMLVRVAGLRLGFDLLRRRLARHEEESTERSAPAASRDRSEGGQTGLQPLAEGAPATGAGRGLSEAELEAVQRYAKLVATDIRLYNEDAVVQGRRDGDLAARLGDQLRRGKETFARRYGSLGADGVRLLHEAYVQVLAGGNGDLLPRSLLD